MHAVNGGEICLDGVLVPKCNQFKYFRFIIQVLDNGVIHKINTGWMKWSLIGVLCNHNKVKGKFCRTVIKQIILYGSECWTAKIQHMHKMIVAEIQILRWVFGNMIIDKIGMTTSIRGCMQQRVKIKRERLF